MARADYLTLRTWIAGDDLAELKSAFGANSNALLWRLNDVYEGRSGL